MEPVINLQQPFASLVVHGLLKVVGTITPIVPKEQILVYAKPGPLTIKRLRDARFSAIRKEITKLEGSEELPTGKILGSIRIQSCVSNKELSLLAKSKERKWLLEHRDLFNAIKKGDSIKNYAWIFDNPQPFEPHEQVPVIVGSESALFTNFRRCRKCGCSECDPCMHDELGNCYWIDLDLCSHCVDVKTHAESTRDYSGLILGSKTAAL